MDKFKHTTVKYVSGDREARLQANSPEFRKMTALDEEEQYFELELAKQSITMTLPIQVAFFVLQYAKLLILAYFYSFLDVYLDRSCFELISMDTVSIIKFCTHLKLYTLEILKYLFFSVHLIPMFYSTGQLLLCTQHT